MSYIGGGGSRPTWMNVGPQDMPSNGDLAVTPEDLESFGDAMVDEARNNFMPNLHTGFLQISRELLGYENQGQGGSMLPNQALFDSLARSNTYAGMEFGTDCLKGIMALGHGSRYCGRHYDNADRMSGLSISDVIYTFAAPEGDGQAPSGGGGNPDPGKPGQGDDTPPPSPTEDNPITITVADEDANHDSDFDDPGESHEETIYVIQGENDGMRSMSDVDPLDREDDKPQPPRLIS